jgi:hypothetical protein
VDVAPAEYSKTYFTRECFLTGNFHVRFYPLEQR